MDFVQFPVFSMRRQGANVRIKDDAVAQENAP
jgi:hypothetical protein